MTLKDLAVEIAKIEGKKSEARIGDIREILSILSDLSWADPRVYELIINNGGRRSKKKKK